jgi:quinol monooxygenase YgiN
MLDERAIQNRVEQVAAAPGQLLVMRFYTASGADFEQQWKTLAAIESQLDGCLWLRLHRNVDDPSGSDREYVTLDLWESRAALVNAIRVMAAQSAYPLAKETRQTFMRLKQDIRGISQSGSASTGNVASIRFFDLKVGTEGEFESLWNESAKHEARTAKVLYKQLHRNLHQPTQYISYSLWPDRNAPDEAASQHTHYQQGRKPYPLSDPVKRLTLDVVDAIYPRPVRV